MGERPTLTLSTIIYASIILQLKIQKNKKTAIVPLPLNVFQKMLEDSYKVSYTPTPDHVREFFEYSNELVTTCENEIEWFEKLKQSAMSWLAQPQNNEAV